MVQPRLSTGRAGTARITRRHILLASGAAAFLVACGSDDNDSGSGASQAPQAGATQAAAATPAGQPKVGGTVRYPLYGLSSGDPPTLFPFENLTYLAQHPATLHYSRLLRSVSGPDINPGDYTKLAGDVAATLPEQPDPTTYVFKFRDNLFWHDKPPLNGRKATARDFANTWNEFKAKSTNFPAFDAVIDRLEASDDSTLTIKLKFPFAPFLTTHASSAEGIWFIPVETIQNDQVKRDPVGTGPYIFRQYDQGAAIRWDRNPKFYETPIPYYERVEMSLQSDPARLIAALQAGQLDYSGLAATVYNDAKRSVDPKGTFTFIPTGVLGGVYFNFDIRPWQDVRVRQALSMSIDRAGMLKVQDQTGEGDWQSHISPQMAPYFMSPLKNEREFGPNAKYFKRDIAEAKKLLAAAGFANGLNFKITANVDRYGAQAQQTWEQIQSSIAEAGFRGELFFQEYGTYIQSTFLGKFTEGVAVGPLIGSPRDPDDIFSRNFASSSARHNWGGTPIPEMKDLDARFEKQRTIMNIDERVKEIKEIQRVMAESMLIVPYIGTPVVAYVQPWIQGYYEKGGYAYHMESMARSWFTDERLRRGP
jgi:peptide/nickel transport system substrate-binding protein